MALEFFLPAMLPNVNDHRLKLRCATTLLLNYVPVRVLGHRLCELPSVPLYE